MARFRAYTSDSDDSDEDVSMEIQPPKPAKPIASSTMNNNRPVASRPHGVSSAETTDEEEDYEEEESSASDGAYEEEQGSSEGEVQAQVEVPVPVPSLVPVEVDTREQSVSKPQQRGDPTIIPWARELGVDANRVHVMQTSLFRMPEEERAIKALNGPLPRRKLVLPSSHSRKHSRDSEGEGHRADSRQVCLFAFTYY